MSNRPTLIFDLTGDILMALGTKTANIMDTPLHISSVVAPFIGDNGYKFEGLNSVRVLSISDGSLANYDETSATVPFGAASLVVPIEQVLTLAYNKSMLLRIQNTQALGAIADAARAALTNAA